MTSVLMEKLVVCGKKIDPKFAFKRAKSSVPQRAQTASQSLFSRRSLKQMLQLYWKTYRQRKRKGKVQLIDQCLEALLTLTICVFACVEIKGWVNKQSTEKVKNMKYAQILILLMQIYFIWFPWSRFFHSHLMQNYVFYILIYKHIILILFAIHYFWHIRCQ